jgi:hypothetical protein
MRIGMAAERLLCHPRLPLIAGWEPGRPAIRIWRHDGELIRELALIGGETVPYGNGYGSDRDSRTPGAAWHPEEPQLVVSGADDLVRWTPAGAETLETDQPTIGFRSVAFSPDGRTLWLSPAPGWEHDWQRSVALDLATGDTATGPGWDTGVAVHPAGGLVVTMTSDQAETEVYFATITDGTPAVMRPLRRALSLACDGYETPVFSADGRYLAIRGGAYEHFVEVFAFPSLLRVAGLGLGEPYPDPDDSWSFRNTTFGAAPGVLWVGTPAGSLVEYDVDDGRLVEHPPVTSPITALATTATGALAIASTDGDLLVLDVEGAPGPVAGKGVAAFIDATEPAPPLSDDEGQDEEDEDEVVGRFDFVESPQAPWIHVSPGSAPGRS